MIIDSINLNHLRIFECVYRTKSMTLAAQELHLTQSGVSQHIKSLEDTIGVKLFDRVKQKLLPTQQATVLFRKSNEGLSQIEQVLSELKGGERVLNGPVSIGMPNEFGNNVLLPILSKIGKKHRGVRFVLRYGATRETNEALLNGELDFAFVDGFGVDQRLKMEKVYDEVLQLCASQEYLKSRDIKDPKETKELFESFDYMDYASGEPVLRMWFKHHYPHWHLKLNVRATLMNVYGVSRMILNDFAAGVLPEHFVLNKMGEGRKLYVFKGSGKPLKNSIFLTHLEEKTASHAVQSVKASIIEELRKTQKSGL